MLNTARSTNPLVTGATGFLGSWVTRALVASGYRPRVLVRDPTRLTSLQGLDVEIAAGDILDGQSLARAMDGIGAVIHIAGLVALRPRDADRLFQVNVDGTRNVLEAAAARELRVLHTSSIATIGLTRDPVALNESASNGDDVKIDYPYLESKRQGEALALASARRGVDTVVLVPGNLLGPGDVNRTSTRFVRSYLNGTFRFYLSGGISFGDVRDVARAYVQALHDGRRGERYILAGVNLSYAQLLDQLWRLTDLYPPLPSLWPMAELFASWSQLLSTYAPHPFEEINPTVVAYGKHFNFCDSAKASAEIDYRLRPFTETLRDTIADILASGEARAATTKLRQLVQDAATASQCLHSVTVPSSQRRIG